MTWKERFVQIFMEGALNFPVLTRISGQGDDLWELSKAAQNCQIWPKRAAHDLKSGFCTIFFESCTVFLFRREFQASFTILENFAAQNCAICAKTLLRMTWKEFKVCVQF